MSESARAAELRRAFDETFAAPHSGPGEPQESLILIRVGGQPWVVRTSEIAGLTRRTRIVPLPAHAPELLGIMALRGRLLAVYDLARLLGVSTGKGEVSWLLLANPEAPVALAFELFEKQIELPRQCLCEDDRFKARRVARMEGEIRPVIDIAGLVEIIRQRTCPPAPGATSDDT